MGIMAALVEVEGMAVSTAPIRTEAPASLARFGSRLPAGLALALALFVTLRLALSLVGVAAVELFAAPEPCGGASSVSAPPHLHGEGWAFRLLGVWQRWDVCWYEKIAANGYQPTAYGHGIHFAPLFPVAMRLVSLPLGGNLTLAGLVVSGLAYVAAMTLLYRLVGDDFGPEVAARTTLYLSTFPTAFFLFVPYTEALFLALGLWALYAARRGAWGWAALAGALIGLARLQGALLALPLAWEALRQWRAGRRSPAALLAPLLPLLTWSLFLAYGKLVSGVTAFGEIGQGWAVHFVPPWVAIMESWRFIRTHGHLIEALNLAAVLLVAVLLLLGARRLPLLYLLYALPQLLLTVSRVADWPPLISSARYVLVLFPAFVVPALLLRRRALHYAVLIVSALGLVFLAAMFGQMYYVG